MQPALSLQLYQHIPDTIRGLIHIRSFDMPTTGWPVVGQEAPSTAAHAAELVNDIANLRTYLDHSTGDVPREVFSQFVASVSSFVDRVLAQPHLDRLMETMTRIDANTAALLERTSNAQTLSVPASTPAEATTSKRLEDRASDEIAITRKEISQGNQGLCSCLKEPVAF